MGQSVSCMEGGPFCEILLDVSQQMGFIKNAESG
jgi:hypothetical protein